MTPMINAIIQVKTDLADDDWLFAQATVDQNLGVAQPIGQLEHMVIEDVWFIHSGISTIDIKEMLYQALVSLGYGDALWPINGAEGEMLVGPFESYQDAEILADKLYNETGEPVWVTLVPADVL